MDQWMSLRIPWIKTPMMEATRYCYQIPSFRLCIGNMWGNYFSNFFFRSCVYFRKSGNGRLHDVVRATFSNELQISVLCTGVLLWIAMLAITVTTARYCDNDSEFWEPTEALIWTISILCMQGKFYRKFGEILSFKLILATLTFSVPIISK